ncbi:MAG: hypothetical protein JW884_09325 [Deltaproteobacteria bacterium]|nr:hypothetical protein [Deltaproteobacteria bacterium]
MDNADNRPEFYDGMERSLVVYDREKPPALVCEEDQKLVTVIKAVLNGMGFTAAGVSKVDEALKYLRFHLYRIVVVNELFNCSDPADNQVKVCLLALPMSVRRQSLVILTGSRFESMNPLEAFQQSVDAVINVAHMDDMGFIVKRTLDDQTGRYRIFQEYLRQAGRI